jgi:hypothetical protein
VLVQHGPFHCCTNGCFSLSFVLFHACSRTLQTLKTEDSIPQIQPSISVVSKLCIVHHQTENKLGQAEWLMPLERQRLGGQKFEASPGKKLVKPCLKEQGDCGNSGL